MKVSCPNCGAGVPSRNINIQEMLGVCEQCDSVFRLRLGRKRKAQPPPNFEVMDLPDGGVHIHYGWGKTLGVGEQAGMAFYGLIIVALAVAGLPAMLSGEIFGGLVFFMLAALMGLGFALVMLNGSDIRLTEDEISLTHRPVQLGRRHFDRADIARVVAKPSGMNQNAYGYYAVMLQRHDGSELPLMDSVRRELAFFIAQTLDEALQNTSENDSPFVDLVDDVQGGVAALDEPARAQARQQPANR